MLNCLSCPFPSPAPLLLRPLSFSGSFPNLIDVGRSYHLATLCVPEDSKILVPEKLWRQKSSGVSKVSGVSKILVPASSGARKVLVPEKLWCQQSSGVSKILVPEKFWC